MFLRRHGRCIGERVPLDARGSSGSVRARVSRGGARRVAPSARGGGRRGERETGRRRRRFGPPRGSLEIRRGPRRRRNHGKLVGKHGQPVVDGARDARLLPERPLAPPPRGDVRVSPRRRTVRRPKKGFRRRRRRNRRLRRRRESLRDARFARGCFRSVPPRLRARPRGRERDGRDGVRQGGAGRGSERGEAGWSRGFGFGRQKRVPRRVGGPRRGVRAGGVSLAAGDAVAGGDHPRRRGHQARAKPSGVGRGVRGARGDAGGVPEGARGGRRESRRRREFFEKGGARGRRRRRLRAFLRHSVSSVRPAALSRFSRRLERSRTPSSKARSVGPASASSFAPSRRLPRRRRATPSPSLWRFSRSTRPSPTGLVAAVARTARVFVSGSRSTATRSAAGGRFAPWRAASARAFARRSSGA